MRWFF